MLRWSSGYKPNDGYPATSKEKLNYHREGKEGCFLSPIPGVSVPFSSLSDIHQYIHVYFLVVLLRFITLMINGRKSLISHYVWFLNTYGLSPQYLADLCVTKGDTRRLTSSNQSRLKLITTKAKSLGNRLSTCATPKVESASRQLQQKQQFQTLLVRIFQDFLRKWYLGKFLLISGLVEYLNATFSMKQFSLKVRFKIEVLRGRILDRAVAALLQSKNNTINTTSIIKINTSFQCKKL